jgi:hypothetical protein
MPHPFTNGVRINRGFRHPPLGTRIGNANLPMRSHLITEEALPATYKYDPTQLTPARDQGQCGSCWAFAITTAIADRIKIKGGPAVPLSVQNLINCFGRTCGGADVDEALQSLPPDAYIDETAAPYVQGDGNSKFGKCISTPPGYYASIQKFDTYQIDGTGRDLIRNMKAHIYHDGPIIGAMLAVYPDFNDYDGTSIYDPSPNQTSEGGHAIEIIGWGKNEDGVEYWICRNSWGSVWPASHLPGEGEGWFYVKMGVNASRIEEYAYACIPSPNNVATAQITTDTDAYPDSTPDTGPVNPPDYPPVITSSQSKSTHTDVLLTLLVIVAVLYIIYRVSRKRN